MSNKKLPKYNGVEPMLFMVAEDKVFPGARYGPAIRNSYIIECNEEGYGSVIINGKHFSVKPRDCYIILPGQMTTYTADEINPRRGISCFLSGVRVGKILAEIGITPENPYVRPELFDEIVALAYKMLAMKSDTDRGADFRRTACIYEILGVLTKNKPSLDEEYWVEKAMGLFEAQYENKISIADIAADVGFDRSYFSTIFKTRTGVTPHAYLTSLRVAKACVLLRESDNTVSEIAESVGLDPCNFARLFKRVTGKSPLDYKKNPDH